MLNLLLTHPETLRGLISMTTNISFTLQLEDKLTRHATRIANTMVPIYISMDGLK